MGDVCDIIRSTDRQTVRVDGKYPYITDNEILMTSRIFPDNMECVLLVISGKNIGISYYWSGGEFTADEHLYLIKKG